MRPKLTFSFVAIMLVVASCRTTSRVAVTRQSMPEAAAAGLQAALSGLGSKSPGAVLRVVSPARGTCAIVFARRMAR